MLDPKYHTLVDATATRYNVPRELVYADINSREDASGDPLAVGDGGLALGLMQVHTQACATVGKSWAALRAAITSGDADTAATLSVDAGTAYLRWCYDRFAEVSIDTERWRFALMAYNQGPTVITRALRYAEAVLAGETQGETQNA